MAAWRRSDAHRQDHTARIGSHTIRSVRNGDIQMSIENNIQTVKDFFAAIGRGDRQALEALVAEDIDWIIPG